MTGLIETRDDDDDETANLYRDSGADPLDKDLDEEDDDEEAADVEQDEGEEAEDLDLGALDPAATDGLSVF